MHDVLTNISLDPGFSKLSLKFDQVMDFSCVASEFFECLCVCAPQSFAWPAPIVCETLLTNMTNDVADNDAAYCSISSKEKSRAAKAFLH